MKIAIKINGDIEIEFFLPSLWFSPWRNFETFFFDGELAWGLDERRNEFDELFPDAVV